MKIELSAVPFLAISQIGEFASNLDLVHARVLKTIERLHRDVQTRKFEIANRWKQIAVDDADRRRFVDQENSSAISTIRQNAKQELDNLLKEAGAAYYRISDQKPYYAGRTTVLNRQGLGTDKRCQYESTAARARSVSLAGMMQFAIGTSDLVLAAALVQENDARRESERGFDTREAVKLLKLDEYEKAQEYIRLADVRFQAVVLAIRTWSMGKSNPLETVTLALRKRELEAVSSEKVDA